MKDQITKTDCCEFIDNLKTWIEQVCNAQHSPHVEDAIRENELRDTIYDRLFELVGNVDTEI